MTMSRSDRRQGRFARLAAWLDDWWAEVVQAVLAELLAMWSVWGSAGFPDLGSRRFWLDHYGWLAGLCTVALAVLTWRIVTHGKSRRQLEVRLNQCERQLGELPTYARAVCDSALRDLAAQNELGFGAKPGNTERISVYFRDDTTSRFVLIGRYSANPQYAVTGRPSYPADEGCIGKAWRNGTAFYPRLPKPGPTEDYAAACRKMGIPVEVGLQLTMPSRLYYGKRLEDATPGTLVGVLVIESTSPGRWTQNELDAATDYDRCLRLAQLVLTLRNLLPRPSEARKEGF